MTQTVREQARWLADKLAAQDRKIAGLEGRGDLAHSSIENGAVQEFDLEGNLVSSLGRQEDGSHVQVPYTGPKPAAPTAAQLSAVPGMAEVRWNGKFMGGAVSSMDFKHVAVYASNSPEVDITPSAQLATMRGELGDIVTVATAVPGPLYVVLVAWTAAGKFSDPSPVSMVEVPPLVDTAELNEKLAQAQADVAAAQLRLAGAEQDIVDAFGELETVDSRISEANAAVIESATSMTNGIGKNLSSTSAPSEANRAPQGSIWRRTDTNGRIIARWEQTGAHVAGEWTPRLITSETIDNVDVGKLSATTAAIDTLVARKIAAAAAIFLELDVGQLTGVSGTFSEVVSKKIWADLGAFNEVTAEMVAADAINGMTITGATVRTKVSGDRVEMAGNLLTAYGRVGTVPVNVKLGPAVVSPVAGGTKVVGVGFDNGSAYPGGMYSAGTDDLTIVSGGFGGAGTSRLVLESGTGAATVLYSYGSLELNSRSGVNLSGGAGPVDLGGSLVRANGKEIAVTDPTLLAATGTNMNNYTSPGLYSQNGNAGAAAGSNYPIDSAGMLEVMSNGTNMVYQRYTVYNSGVVYNRTKYGTTWYAWSEVAQETSWVALGLQYGWANYSGGGNYQAGVRARRFGATVQVNGMIKSGAIGSNIVQLPAGWRPANSMLVPAVAAAVFGAVQFDQTTGFLKYAVGPTAPSYLAFTISLPLT